MHDGQTAINLYLNRKASTIMHSAAEGLRMHGLNVTRGLNDPPRHLTITKGDIRAVWNLTSVMWTIATDTQGAYDSRLSNTGFELAKTTAVLATSLQVVIALFSGNEERKMQRLEQISRDSHNLSITIYRPGG